MSTLTNYITHSKHVTPPFCMYTSIVRHSSLDRKCNIIDKMTNYNLFIIKKKKPFVSLPQEHPNEVPNCSLQLIANLSYFKTIIIIIANLSTYFVT